MAVVKAKEKEKGQKANPDRQRTRSAQSLPASGKTSQRPPRKPFSRQGSTRLAHVPHRPPPPGLDLQSLLKSKMSEQEFNAARAVVYAGADTHVCTLLEAAGIPPPPDEALEPPELTQQEKMTKCVSDFKKATNQLKKLVEKKAKLQARADRLKQDLVFARVASVRSWPASAKTASRALKAGLLESAVRSLKVCAAA